MAGDFLVRPYIDHKNPDLTRFCKGVAQAVNALLRSGALTGGPAGGIDHAGLLNLDYASAGHTDFAGTAVANTFTAVQAVSTGRGTDTLTLHHGAGGGTGNFIFCTDILNGAVFSVAGNSGQCVSTAGFSGPGASLTSLNASELASGTVPDARLSANVTLLGNTNIPLLNGVNTFTGTNTFNTNPVTFNAAPTAPGSSAGSERWGAGAVASNTDATAVGATATASGQLATAVGYGCTASGNFSTVVGYSAVANKTNALALGQQAVASGQPSICVGAASTASGAYSIVIGESSTTAKRAIVVGHSATSGFDDTAVFGNNGAVRAAGQFVWSANGTSPVFLMQQQSSTAATRDTFDVTAVAVDNTDATRKYRAVFHAFDTASRECLRLEASGTAAMLGFFGAAAVAQPASTGETVGFTAGAGTAVRDDSTFTGNVGATAYRLSDVVKALKNLGLLAQ